MSNQSVKSSFINSLVEGCLDPQVHQDLCKTFARETLSFIQHGHLAMSNANPKLIECVQFTECEIASLHTHEIDCSDIPGSDVSRLASVYEFQDQKIELLSLQSLLVKSFSPKNQQGSRPYPSAGGLYPVEPLIFLFPEKINSFDKQVAGCYHFRALSKKLILLKKIQGSYFYETMLHGFLGKERQKWPNFGILYMAHLNKAIIKYRYRGYRHALMEAGSMYQQAAIIAQQMGLRSTVWSTFSEPQLLCELNLDSKTYLPLMMQFFGYRT